MTVEQRAEEYIQGIEGDDCVILTDRAERKQAFIDGYHECQKEHEWHDLRKDPNDLPDTDRIVYVQTKSDTGNAYHDNDGWHSTQVSGIVIAWCEIPTFDKE